MVIDRGIDPNRMVMFPVTTVQEFRTQAIRVLDKYLEQNEADRKPIMLCLDSLGMLSTTKEVEDTADGKETRDMTGCTSSQGCISCIDFETWSCKSSYGCDKPYI